MFLPRESIQLFGYQICSYLCNLSKNIFLVNIHSAVKVRVHSLEKRISELYVFIILLGSYWRLLLPVGWQIRALYLGGCGLTYSFHILIIGEIKKKEKVFPLTWRKSFPKGKISRKFKWRSPIFKSGLCTILHCLQSKHRSFWEHACMCTHSKAFTQSFWFRGSFFKSNFLKVKSLF